MRHLNKSMKIIIKALIKFANRYSNKALDLSKNESDPTERCFDYFCFT